MFFSLIDGKTCCCVRLRSALALERIPIVRVIGEEVRIGARVVRHGLIRFLGPAADRQLCAIGMVGASRWPRRPVPRDAENIWRASSRMAATIGQGNPNVLLYNPGP